MRSYQINYNVVAIEWGIPMDRDGRVARDDYLHKRYSNFHKLVNKNYLYHNILIIN